MTKLEVGKLLTANGGEPMQTTDYLEQKILELEKRVAELEKRMSELESPPCAGCGAPVGMQHRSACNDYI